MTYGSLEIKGGAIVAEGYGTEFAFEVHEIEDGQPGRVVALTIGESDASTIAQALNAAKAGPALPESNILAEARKTMIDLSTAHLSEQDQDLLDRNYESHPRTLGHSYGGIIFVSSYDVASALEELRERGHTPEFIRLYESACQDGNTMLINFDRDADTFEGIATFDR